MGTCKEESQEQHEAQQGPTMEENFIAGPPASRKVIDNLKKLLVQRQHSRESDEGKNVVTRSTSGSNSEDAAFYSQLSTSSSESDSDSDSYYIFEDISNQENRKSNTSGRRHHRRQRSYSSSSSSSQSPAEKRRRKPQGCKNKKSVMLTDDNGRPISQAAHPGSGIKDNFSTHTASREDDSAHATSSHKDSSSDGENLAVKVLEAEGIVTPSTSNRFQKFKTRRDRNRKRRISETNYASNRPTKYNSSPGNSSQIPTIVISHTENDNAMDNTTAATVLTNNTIASITPTENTNVVDTTDTNTGISGTTIQVKTADQKSDE